MAVQLLDTIEKTNPWYRSGKVPPRQLQDFRRRELDPLINDLSTLDFATLLLGGRRVGKSVLMYQMIDFLLQRGVSSINILFIQGDNPILREIHEEKKILPDILELYQKYIIRTQFQDLKETIYIFIDEAQSLINWDEHIKALIDLKYDVKFVVTGSSSFSLRKGAQNPLTGRVNVFFIPPFANFYPFYRKS
jgi:predicted AAA+ superfamily ATPase